MNSWQILKYINTKDSVGKLIFCIIRVLMYESIYSRSMDLWKSYFCLFVDFFFTRLKFYILKNLQSGQFTVKKGYKKAGAIFSEKKTIFSVWKKRFFR